MIQRHVKVIFVGIGGATCSGKTTLAKHLERILPGSVIIHQDDFAPPQELVPMHPIHRVQDWDSPTGAISWDKFIAFLRRVKATGEIPSGHRSHDHLNEQEDIPIAEEFKDSWAAEFQKIKQEHETREAGTKIMWAIVDGFLLYWNLDVIAELDVRIMLRVPHDVLEKRRHERHGYHTAEGDLWRDPPNYWGQIIYPAYLEAHRDVFANGDVEHGVPTDKVKGLVLLDTLEMTMGEAVDRSCRVLKEAI